MLNGLSRQIGQAEGANVVPLIRYGTGAFLAMLWLFFLAAAALSLWLLLARAEAETQATAESLEEYARRSIEISDFVTEEFNAFLDRRGSTEGLRDDAAVNAEVRRLNRRLPKGSATIFVSARGIVEVSSSPLPDRPINLSDRHWFKMHTEQGATAYIGPAILSRVINRIIFTYTRSYRSADGQLKGIVNLGIPSDSLIGLSPGSSGVTVALLQHQGAVVAAEPISTDMLEKPLILPGAPPAEQQTMIGHDRGHWSVVTVKNLTGYGLYAIAAVPLLQALAPALWGIALGGLALALLTAVMLQLSRLAQKKSLQVEQALADNSVLFQEVHHRVKNNLQVISSLIRMQTDRLPEELRPLMEQTAARVRAIAMVHEQIYSASTPSVVQLDQFLEELLRQIETSMMAGGKAALTTSLAPVAVGLDRAVPVALLATEAITNAIKHGISEEGGAIAITLREEGGRNILEVTDSGNGTGNDAAKAGLGTRIMAALCRQIEGEWALEPSAQGGTRFFLAWPAR